MILLSPHCHGDDYQPAYNNRVIPYCDLYLAITGRYWFQDIPGSGYSHWMPKMRHIDLAVDRKHFPVIKRSFNAPGKRKFLYVGSSAWYKNVPYLRKLADLLPAGQLSWIGTDVSQNGIRALGRHDFRQPASQALVAEHDFLLTVGKADGNPTSILEAMAWGLVPVCTKESGYSGYDSIINLPINDLHGARDILALLQHRATADLERFQDANWSLLDTHFNWDRFAQQVIDAIEAPDSPRLGAISLRRKVEIAWAEMTTPFWRDALNPLKIGRRIRKFV